MKNWSTENKVLVWVILFDLSVVLLAWTIPGVVPIVGPLISAEKIISILGTAIATFFGAWVAFTFAKRGRDLERIEAEVAAGNRALFTLLTMWNRTKQHQIEVVDSQRKKADAWLNLNATAMRGGLSFEARDLSFVMQKSAPVFQSLMLEEDRFFMLASLVEDHRNLLFDTVWPAMQAAGIKLNQATPETEIEAILGAGIVQRLKVMTAAIISSTDDNVVSIAKAFGELKSALATIHPKRKFVNAELPKPAVRPVGFWR